MAVSIQSEKSGRANADKYKNICDESFITNILYWRFMQLQNASEERCPETKIKYSFRSCVTGCSQEGGPK